MWKCDQRKNQHLLTPHMLMYSYEWRCYIWSNSLWWKTAMVRLYDIGNHDNVQYTSIYLVFVIHQLSVISQVTSISHLIILPISSDHLIKAGVFQITSFGGLNFQHKPYPVWNEDENRQKDLDIQHSGLLLTVQPALQWQSKSQCETNGSICHYVCCIHYHKSNISLVHKH